MSEIAVAKINSFAPLAAQTDFPVSPSEEAVFILNSGQLSALITKAIEKAIEPLQDRVKDLEKIVAAQGEMIVTLASTQEQDVNRICLDIAFDRQRLAKLERVEPQPMQRDRGEILRALIAANGGKMLSKDARLKMHLGKEQKRSRAIKSDIERLNLFFKADCIYYRAHSLLSWLLQNLRT